MWSRGAGAAVAPGDCDSADYSGDIDNAGSGVAGVVGSVRPFSPAASHRFFSAASNLRPASLKRLSGVFGEFHQLQNKRREASAFLFNAVAGRSVSGAARYE